MKRVSVQDMAVVLSREMSTYSRVVTDELKKEVQSAARKMASELKETSPNDRGDYASGWTTATENVGAHSISTRVYNRTRPQLTHLLEHGHAKTTGGYVDGKPHIYPAEKRAEDLLERRISGILE